MERISGFHEKTATFKIEVFSWFLHQVKNKERFAPSDILPCFDATHSQRPSNIYGQMNALSKRKPARFLKDKNGYRLSAIARNEMQILLPLREHGKATTEMLSALIPSLQDEAQHSFLTEAITCYSHGAYRAAIVMVWNLAYSHVCDRIFRNSLPKFNAQLAKILPKSNEVVKRADFDDLKESKVIEVARSAGILSAATAKILKEKLDKRNMAAHPTVAKISAITVEEVIHDLVENVVLNAEI